MEPVVLASARKHQGQGFTDADIRHAMANPVNVEPLDGEPGEDTVMVIGPTRDGQLMLEVGVAVDDEGRRWVFHAMRARPKYLR